MITNPDQWHYVLAAYLVAGLVLAGLVAWVLLDGRRRASELAELEARGVRRRSDATP